MGLEGSAQCGPRFHTVFVVTFVECLSTMCERFVLVFTLMSAASLVGDCSAKYAREFLVFGFKLTESISAVAVD